MLEEGFSRSWCTINRGVGSILLDTSLKFRAASEGLFGKRLRRSGWCTTVPRYTQSIRVGWLEGGARWPNVTNVVEATSAQGTPPSVLTVGADRALACRQNRRKRSPPPAAWATAKGPTATAFSTAKECLSARYGMVWNGIERYGTVWYGMVCTCWQVYYHLSRHGQKIIFLSSRRR